MAREKPIIFSAPMVLAILAGRKIQTRRVLNPQPHPDTTDVDWNHANKAWVPWRLGTGTSSSGYRTGSPIKPAYQIGDELWVREAFRLRADQDHKPPSEDYWKNGAWYEADHYPHGIEPSGCGGGAGKLRSPMYMPRWASRISLRVTEVRVERVQAISASDVLAEGLELAADGYSVRVPFLSDEPPVVYAAPSTAYAFGWDHLHGEGAWDKNEWVWCVGFERISLAERSNVSMIR